jgi:hypothetical protein
MQHKVTEFVRGVHATVFRRLVRLQKNKRDVLVPKRERVKALALLGKRVHAYAFGLEQMNQVADWELADAPMRPDHHRRRFRSLILMDGMSAAGSSNWSSIHCDNSNANVPAASAASRAGSALPVSKSYKLRVVNFRLLASSTFVMPRRRRARTSRSGLKVQVSRISGFTTSNHYIAFNRGSLEDRQPRRVERNRRQDNPGYLFGIFQPTCSSSFSIAGERSTVLRRTSGRRSCRFAAHRVVFCRDLLSGTSHDIPPNRIGCNNLLSAQKQRQTRRSWVVSCLTCQPVHVNAVARPRLNRSQLAPTVSTIFPFG